MRPAPLIAAVLLVISATAAAQTVTGEVAPFAGWQGGGSVTLDGEDTDVEPSAVFGVTISFDRGPGRKLDVVLSHQQTTAERRDPFEPVVSADVTVDYAQIGGRVLLKPDQRVDPYVGMTAGVTRFEVDNGSAFRLSFALGGGVDLKISDRTALRLDGRYIHTFTGGSVTISCRSEGECSGFGSGSSFAQLAGTAGLVIRF